MSDGCRSDHGGQRVCARAHRPDAGATIRESTPALRHEEPAWPGPPSGALRVDRLLRSMIAVADGLDLEETLARVVREAVDLVDARYGALGLLDDDGTGLARFVTVGVDEPTRAGLGSPPTGRGLLGELIRRPVPLRVDDLGGHPAAVGLPPGHPPMTSFLGVPVRVRDRVVGNLYLTDKRGGSFTADDEDVTAALAAAAGIAVENARLHERTRRLVAESRLRQRWLEASGEVTTTLLAGADPEEALALVAQRAAELLGASGALITTGPRAVPAGDDQPVRVTVSVGLGGRHPAGSRLPLRGTVLEAVGRTGTPQAVEHLVLRPGDRDEGAGFAVPMRGSEEISGVLVVAGVAGWMRSADDDGLSILASFADQAALVLRHAESQRARRQLDVVTDRERIAGDLHDHVLQRLFALGLGLQAAHARLPASDAAQRVDDAVDQIDGIIRDIRTSIFDLHTARGGGELAERVHAAAAEMAADTDVDPVVRVSGAVDEVPDDLVVAVEAVVREGVSNAVRHAAPTHVVVTVSADSTLTVEVVDDGIGIPDEVARSGLANLTARARAVGGDARVARLPVGSGTRLTWWVPLGPDSTPGATEESGR
ncbi:GAF domain-containing protein [Actinomycetospora endophytica]|uniref:GAF domain-containing protein n=1 Tax=Actinomycetospora endophytica TaxID=2291215 RepID=A0ABS8PC75_9PSEU|nr:GAF domain-containing protein [Actinomycetospora endophytica]MCD2195828.1 GAF domain-containing protein [Actinomycetospora endophytica]